MNVTFFKSQNEFRDWLEANHGSVAELWVGFYNKQSRKGGLTYREALDEALCYGWIDGVRKKVDENSYTNRFSPRKARSNWSLINIKRVEELKALGKMMPPGVSAFEMRNTTQSVYTHEQRKKTELGAAHRKRFKADAKAWKFFISQPPGYQRLASWYVMSAKKEETRARRLARLINDSRNGRRLPIMTGKAEVQTLAPTSR
jgi:uncharacterized protein YdeI (YjbR/CyaY-like superfamily)